MKARYGPFLSVTLVPRDDIRRGFIHRRLSLDEEAPMNIRYHVELSEAERGELHAMLSGGKQAARKLKRAQILLAAHAGVPDEAIATSVAVGGSTVYRTKRRLVEGNLERALSEEPRPGAERKLSGKEEALLGATAGLGATAARPRLRAAPAGPLSCWRARWCGSPSMNASRETVRRRLAENEIKPWRRKMGCV